MAFGLNFLARIGLNAAPLQQGLKGVRGSVDQAGKAMASSLRNQLAGVFAAGALARYTKSLIDWGSNIQDTATALGITTDELQKFQYAAEQSGASAETVAKAFKQLSVARLTALKTSTSDEAQAFAALGLNPDALKSSTISDLFRKIAEKIRTTDFGASETGILDKLLGGRQAQELIPVFLSDLNAAGKALESMGGVIDSGIVDGLKRASDAMTDFKYEARSVFATVSGYAAKQGLLMAEHVKAIGSAIGSAFGAMKSDATAKGVFSALKSGWLTAWDDIAEQAGVRAEERLRVSMQRSNRERATFEFANATAATAAKVKPADVLKMLSPKSDSLLSIGNYLGQDTGAREQRELQKKSADYLRMIERNTARQAPYENSFPL